MTQLSEKATAAAAALSAIAALLLGLMGERTGLLVFSALLPLALLALAVALVAWTRARLGRLAEEERRDAELAKTEQPGAALFEASETEPFSLDRTTAQIEQWAVPTVPLLLSAAFGWAAWRLFHGTDALLAQPREGLLAAAALGGLAFVLFLFSRYLLGVARAPNERLARAPGIILGLTSLGAAAGAITAVATHLGYPVADRWLARGLIGVLALLAAEMFILFLLSLYAPRSRQRGPRMPYESRLGALLTDPATWARSLAESFDYQFGVSVSETASMRFLRRALLPLVMLQLVLFYLMSCLVFLGPEEEGILEQLGRPHPTRAHLTSGFHAKAPWPFATVRRVPAKRVLTARVGFEPEGDEIRPATLLWTVPHYRQEDTFVTAGETVGGEGDATSVGLVSFNAPVEYRVTNLLQFIYGHAEPGALVRDLAYRALTRELASRNLVHVLGADRLEVGARVRERIQHDADQRGLGIAVLFVGVQGVHPPVAVAPAFQSVVGALEQREAMILEAHAYANSTIPLATAEAARLRSEAGAVKVRRSVLAQADADLFEKRLLTYRSSPVVFTSDLYLGAITRALAGTRKFVVDHDKAREVLTFNFEEKAYPDLFDLGPAPEEVTAP
jgi:regulator of protease activity HflC (stomatin/prohibitin superfamily)